MKIITLTLVFAASAFAGDYDWRAEAARSQQQDQLDRIEKQLQQVQVEQERQDYKIEQAEWQQRREELDRLILMDRSRKQKTDLLE